MKELLDSYVAGLIDGEGTITLSHNNRTDRFRVPVVSMTSTTPELTRIVADEFGGSVRIHKTYRQGHSDSYIWSIRHDRALAMLQRVIPYLREPEKKQRARLILDRYKSVTPRNGKYSAEKTAAKFEFEYLFFHPSTP